MIILGSDDLTRIAAQAEAAFPAEGCGLLVGRGRTIVRVGWVVAAANLERNRRNDRFELDPRVRIAVERGLRGGPDRIVGHWHSHPGGSANPSAEDIARAFEPDLIWLIIGVAADRDGHPRAGRPRAHRLCADSGTARPEPLRLRVDAP